MTDGARDVILSRVRDALAVPVPSVEVPREYRMRLVSDREPADVFGDRVVAYGAGLRRVPRSAIAEGIHAALSSHGARRVVIPAGLTREWIDPSAVEVIVDDPPLENAIVDAADAVVTRCAIAIAETGTIVLDGGVDQGRRALTLLPDLHVCVVGEDRIRGTVAEALQVLAPHRPLTWISGPSATSDIELRRIEGVHGPRRLEVILVVD